MEKARERESALFKLSSASFVPLAGYFSVLPLLPHIVRERRALQLNLKLTLAQVAQLLTPTMNEPPLRELARIWWRNKTNKI